MIIHLLRHGQTTGDVENRYGGDYDDHLTNLGQAQSKQLGESLIGKDIEQLYTSPRIRAQETAAIIADKIDLKAATLDEFRERNGYGILTGMTKDEAAQQQPDQVELLKDVHNAVEGAEPYVDFQRRITKALKTVSEERADRIAIVTHGGPIRLIFRDILKLGEIEVSDCARIVLSATNGNFELIETSGVNKKE